MERQKSIAWKLGPTVLLLALAAATLTLSGITSGCGGGGGRGQASPTPTPTATPTATPTPTPTPVPTPVVLISESFNSAANPYAPAATASGAGTDYTLVDAGTFHVPPAYRIITNPGTVFAGNGDASFGDHTTGFGQMFFFDGADHATQRIWFETLTLTTGKTYTFSFWGASSNAGSVPILNARLNALVIPDSTALTTATGAWLKYSVSFTVPTTGSYTLSIVDEKTEFASNDGAIDDILLTGI